MLAFKLALIQAVYLINDRVNQYLKIYFKMDYLSLTFRVRGILH
jgi:hypothetical protein